MNKAKLISDITSNVISKSSNIPVDGFKLIYYNTTGGSLSQGMSIKAGEFIKRTLESYFQPYDEYVLIDGYVVDIFVTFGYDSKKTQAIKQNLEKYGDRARILNLSPKINKALWQGIPVWKAEQFTEFGGLTSKDIIDAIATMLVTSTRT